MVVVVCKQVYNQTAAEFAPKLIAYVKSKNLKFVTVSECKSPMMIKVPLTDLDFIVFLGLGVDAYKSTPIQL